jgi:hypothetical protein
MTSAINGAIPVSGAAIQAGPIQTNFSTAASEITALQNAAAAATVTMNGDVTGPSNTSVVGKVNGVAVTGTPASGNVLTATAANAAHWAAPAGGGGASLPLAGTNANIQPAATGSLIHIASTDGVNTSEQIDSSGGGVPALELRKMGGSMASPSLPATNTQLGFLRVQGYVGAGTGDGGTPFGAGFEIQVLTTSTAAWTSSGYGTVVQFLTTADSESTKSRKMYIGSKGGLVVGNAIGGDMGPGTINVAGALYVNGTAVTVP